MLVRLCSVDGVALVSMHSVEGVLSMYLCVADDWVGWSGR